MFANADTANSASWYYQIMGATFGPVQHEEMRTLIAQGDIGRDTLVKSARHDSWYTADRFDELTEGSQKEI